MKKKQNYNKQKVILFVLIAIVIIVGCVFFSIEIFQLKSKQAELETRKARLEELLENEQLRQELLQNEQVYIQTKKYIEEKAKSIGYVYPDEIIFKKQD